MTRPPMATPPVAAMGEGSKAQARAKLSIAIRALIDALNILKDVKSEEGKVIVGMLKLGSQITPEVDEGISRNELKSWMAGADAAQPGPGAFGGPIGPMGPRPVAMAGVPFGMNQPVGRPMANAPEGPGGGP